jgi:hypothetical protein
MPIETQDAINWALQQQFVGEFTTIQVTKDTPQLFVDKVREYFNTNKILYESFSYDDLQPYLL